MPRPTEMSAWVSSVKDHTIHLVTYKAELHWLLIHILHVSSCPILLFSPSLNALAIPVYMSCTSLEARSPCLPGTVQTSARLRTWTRYTTAPSHSRCLYYLPTQTKHHTRRLTAILHSKHFSCYPLYRSLPVQTDWLLHKSCTTVTPPQCYLYDLPKNSSIPTTGIHLPSPWGSCYYRELCTSASWWILHNTITQKSLSPPQSFCCAFPDFLIYPCWESQPTLSTHHSVALPVQVKTREEDLAPGIHCCSVQLYFLRPSRREPTCTPC